MARAAKVRVISNPAQYVANAELNLDVARTSHAHPTLRYVGVLVGELSHTNYKQRGLQGGSYGNV